jgi:hypothetical protein
VPTPIALYVQLRQITAAPGGGGNANVVAIDTALIAFDFPVEVDKVSQAFIEVTNDSPLADALEAAAGGTVPSTATQKLHAEISFSGTSAGPFDYRFIVESIDRGLTVIARGRCIYGGYADNAVARLTLNRTYLGDALNGAAGFIGTHPDPMDSGITYAFTGLTLPYQKGLFLTEPNPPDGVTDLSGHSYYRMPVSVSSTLVHLLVDADSKDNFIDAAAASFVALTVGLPLDGTPLGSYSHIVADTSDASLNLTGLAKGIAVGSLGTSDHLTFARNPSPVDTTKALIIEPAEGLKLITDLSPTICKIKPSGGYSNHGLPVGFTITDGLCVPNNQNQPGDTGHELTTNWYDSLFIFCGYDVSGQGGVYYWPHNGLAYRIGQELDYPTCLVYNKVAGELTSTDARKYACYVGCKSGVFGMSFATFPGPGATWIRQGHLNTSGTTPGAGGVVAVRLASYVADGQAKTCITAQVQGSGPADGIYRADPAPVSPNDKAALTGYGYDGWTAFDTQGPLLGYHYDAAGDTLYTAYSDNPAAVLITNNASTITPTTSTVPVPDGVHIVGIDPLGGSGACIRTELGAQGLYLLGGSMVNLDPGGTLLDRYGTSVKVNRVQFAATGLYIGSSGSPTVPCIYVASTDAGPYVMASSPWLAMPQQSGIGGENVLGTAIGYPQTLGGDSINPGRLTTRMYCWTASSLWVSHSAGIWFDDELQEKTSIGPFISALGKISTGGAGASFLDNSISVIGIGTTAGTPNAPAAAGTSGRALYVTAAAIAANGLQNMASTALWLRPLDERNRFTYLFIDTASASPTGRIVNADFPSIQSDNATPAATAAGKLAQATIRAYHDAAIVPHDVQFDSVLAFQEMALRTLRPSHRVATDYDTSAYYTVNLSTTKFYVRKVRFYKARTDNQVQVQVDASTVFRAAPATDQSIGDGLMTSVSTMIRQGHQ